MATSLSSGTTTSGRSSRERLTCDLGIGRRPLRSRSKPTTQFECELWKVASSASPRNRPWAEAAPVQRKAIEATVANLRTLTGAKISHNISLQQSAASGDLQIRWKIEGQLRKEKLA